MKCPYCGYKESKVIDSRPAEEGSSIRRRRECLSCAKRFTTYETVESLPMVVIKKDGSRQSFDKRKVLNGMIRACEKRPVPFEVLEQKADEIEQTLQNSLEREVSTEYIGELVMDKLRAVDETIRTEPVPTKDLDQLMEELAADEEVVRVKEIEFEPLTEEEALVKIDLLGHDFFAYTDRDTSMVNVLYRRDDGGYGLLKQREEA